MRVTGNETFRLDLIKSAVAALETSIHHIVARLCIRLYDLVSTPSTAQPQANYGIQTSRAIGLHSLVIYGLKDAVDMSSSSAEMYETWSRKWITSPGAWLVTFAVLSNIVTERLRDPSIQNLVLIVSTTDYLNE
ncbi:hypothetical protein ACHAQJ_002503 [Trichoderma viride]